MALTKREIDRSAWDPKGPRIQLHTDGAVPGLYLRVYPTGKKAFVLRYRPSGARQPKLHTLGAYGVLTLHQARELARKALFEAKTGVDPAERRRRDRDGETVKDLCRLYLQRHTKLRPSSRQEAERRIQKHILPAFGSKKVRDLSRAEVAKLHARISAHAPVEANCVVQLLRAMLNKARLWGLLDETAPNPAERVQLNKERSRDRWVQKDELPHLVAAIDAEENLYVRAVLRLYLLTGCRKNELLQLRWKDVDLRRKELRLRETKTEPRIVSLSDPAVQILSELPRELSNAFVFPGSVPGKPLVNISKAWRRVRTRLWLTVNPDAAVELRRQAEVDVQRRPKHAARGEASVEARLLQLADAPARDDNGVRLHDLRRTFGAMLATSGVPIAVVGEALGHKSLGATKVYARIADHAVRTAITDHGERLSALLQGSKLP